MNKKLINFSLFFSLVLPSCSISANITSSNSKNLHNIEQEKKYYYGIATFKKEHLKETDYENLFNIYEPSFKPMGVMGLRKWLVKNGNPYKRIGVAVLDSGHINFDAILKPKNSNVTYESYNDGQLNNFSYHATAVASFIGGISGINPFVDLYSLGSNSKKVKDEWFSISDDEFRRKLDWAISKGVRIFNFSFGYNHNYEKFAEQFEEFYKGKKNQAIEKIEELLNVFYFSSWAKIMDEYAQKYKVIFVKSAGNNRNELKFVYDELNKIREKETNREIIEKIDKIISNFLANEYFLTLGTNQSFNSILVGCLKENRQIAYYSEILNKEIEPSKVLVSAIGHFKFKWNENQKTDYYQKLLDTYENKQIAGTSFSSPIIAGLVSLIISIYDWTIPWTIDAADMKNILALNSIYAKNTYENTPIFNDQMDKYDGILAKRSSGFGLPSWVQIKNYLTRKTKESKNNKWLLIKNNETNSIFIDDKGEFVPDSINKKFFIYDNSRFKVSLSWLDSPKNIVDKESFYKETSDYDLELLDDIPSIGSVSYSSFLKYGNHEFIHKIFKLPFDFSFEYSILDLKIRYIPDKYDTKIENRELKLYYKEYIEYEEPEFSLEEIQ